MPPVRQKESAEFQPQMQGALDQVPAMGGQTVAPDSGLIAPIPQDPNQRQPENPGMMPGDPWCVSPSRRFPQPEDRYRGPGEPLVQESWNSRPLSISGIFGFVQGSPLIDDWIRENEGTMGGVQVGWDCQNYWGLEMRFAGAQIEVVDSQRAIAAQQANDDALGLAPNDRFRHRFDGLRNNDLFIWDGHVLFYPWGDSAVRPYLMAGMGVTTMRFIDRTDVIYKPTLFTVPVGVGLKYRINDFFAIRMECADYMAFGGGSTLDLVHNVMVTGGFEIRFGGQRRAYWPWNPGIHYW